ncbi:MAG TPA: hypothetical protein VNN77_15125 [candidate division Zixibacteria bacterium]|nr:hypothetical protein [candidate division Zixibacteria bacterium]
MLLTLNLIHDLAAAFWVGSVIFNYFLLRPALTLIPAPHAVVISQRVGTVFLYSGWTALSLLGLSGVSRLYLTGDLGILLSSGLWAYGHGRSLALMILAWLVTVVNVAVISFVLRPRLIQKLPVDSDPSLADVEKRRTAQIKAYAWLERLNLINVAVALLAAAAGASIVEGGLF